MAAADPTDETDGGPDGADAGTYVLLVRLGAGSTVAFGAAGEYVLDAGWYAYVGRAFGPGGLSRVDRHRALAAGERDVRHWHVDYLLGHADAALVDAVTLPGRDLECALATALGAIGSVLPLGASDCDCDGHLVYGRTRPVLEAAVWAVAGRA